MMNYKLELINNRGYKWEHYNNIKFKGYVLNEDKSSFIKQIKMCNSYESIVDKIKNSDGQFALIIELNGCIMAFVDHIRSIPLFYEIKESELIIYDHIDTKEIESHNIDKQTLSLFRTSLYTIGNKTLLNNIYQIPAGYYLKYTASGSCKTDCYWEYKYQTEQITDIDSAEKLIKEMYEKNFKAVVDLVKYETVVIPLSGGHDSRLVLYYLHRYGCSNIITYSYGDPSSMDSIISKQVSESFGVPHYFIDYDNNAKKMFNKVLYDYILFASNCASVPVIQEIVAIKTLLNKGIINEDAVVVPGFGGVLTGHYVKEEYMDNELINCSELLSFIKHNFFANKSLTNEEERTIDSFLKELLRIDETTRINGKYANELFEKYVYIDEQPKFIANAVRTYEFYSVSWVLPIMTRAVFDGWCHIDNSLRFSDKVYKKFEKDEYKDSPICTIPFTGSKEIKHFHKINGNSRKGIWKQRLRRYFTPYKVHYLNRLIGIQRYYMDLLKEHNGNINNCVKNEMIQLIFKINRKR